MRNSNTCVKQKRCIQGWVGCLKIITLILCIVGFICNSLVIFKQFIGKKTVTSSDILLNTKMLLPSLTMCSRSAFREKVTKYSDLDLQAYRANTITLDELGYGVMDDERKCDPEMFAIKEIYTLHRGRCFTIEYKKEVKKFYGSKYFFYSSILWLL